MTVSNNSTCLGILSIYISLNLEMRNKTNMHLRNILASRIKNLPIHLFSKNDYVSSSLPGTGPNSKGKRPGPQGVFGDGKGVGS